MNVSKCLTCLFGVICFIMTTMVHPLNAADDSATEKYYSANALYNKKLFKLAVDEYKDFLAKYPNHKKFLSAKLGLALSYYELAQYGKAEPIFEELSENKSAPHQEQVHNLLGQCLLISGKPAEAETAFRWSVNRGKERLFLDLPGVGQKYQESPKISMATIQDLEPLERSLAGLIEALYQQQKYRQVIKVTNDLVKLKPKSQYSLRAKFLSALSCYEMEKYKLAADILETIAEIKTSPYREHCYFLLAECKYRLGSLDDAEKNYEVVAKTIKGRFTANALFRLGYIKFQQKKYKSAIKDFSDLRAIYAKSTYSSQAGLYLGRCYLELSNFSEAQSIFGSLTSDGAVAAESTLWLAKTFVRQKNFDSAIDVLKKGIVKFTKDPLYPNLLFDYASALMNKQSYQEAASIFGKARALFLNEKLKADALRLEAFCLNRSKQYKASIEKCELFIKDFKQDPNIKDVVFLKAENLFFLNDNSQADKIYRQFIPWEGKSKFSEEARYRIVQSLISEKKYQKALSEAEPLLKEKPDNPFFEQLYYLTGFCAFKLKRWQEAISYFSEFLKLHPGKYNSDSALMNIALAHTQLNDNDTAIQYLNTLISNHKDSVHLDQAYTELGKHYYNKKEYKKARENLQYVIEHFPESKFYPYANYYLGWLAIAENKPEDAIARFSMITEKYPTHKLASDSLFQKSILLMKQDKFASAQKELNTILSKFADSEESEEASFFYALALAKQDKHKEAEERFKKFLVDYPKSKLKPRVYYEMAWSARSLGKPLMAIDYYKSLLKEYPFGEFSDRAAFEMAEILYDQKKYNEAIELLDKLMAKEIPEPLKEQVRFRMAWCLLGRDQVAPALELFEQFIDDYPKSDNYSVAAYQAGEGRLLSKEYEDAYRHFKEAVDNDKGTAIKPQAMLRLGETQTLTERWEQAEKTFQKFLKTYPESKFRARGLMWLGWVLENRKKYEDAIKEYSKVIIFGKKDEIAARSQFQIGECYFAMKDYDKAIKAFIKVELNYNSKVWVPKAILEMAQIMIKKKLGKQADQQLKKVIKQYPDTEEAVLARELLVQKKEYNVK